MFSGTINNNQLRWSFILLFFQVKCPSKEYVVILDCGVLALGLWNYPTSDKSFSCFSSRLTLTCSVQEWSTYNLIVPLCYQVCCMHRKCYQMRRTNNNKNVWESIGKIHIWSLNWNVEHCNLLFYGTTWKDQLLYAMQNWSPISRHFEFKFNRIKTW